ncbi:hypothetical protein [Kribbella sp. HUAS MG21]|uniref:Secreted protein n=1 Tax=Kribbella sp. HUAS MG21 TaxID=3160966 RepID=A0AAU7TG77_9ACTN
MRKPAFGAVVVMIVLAVPGGCGSADKPAATVTNSPSPSTTPDDVSVKLLPNEQEVATYTDRDALTHGVDIEVGRNYVLYTRCRGAMLSVEIAGAGPPWYPRCDGVTNRTPRSDGPGVISVQLASAEGTRWTFTVANSGAK